MTDNLLKKVEPSFFSPQAGKNSDNNVAWAIGQGQIMTSIEEIRVALENLKIKSGEKVLEIGSGSGFATTILSLAVESEGRVWALENIEELKKFGVDNYENYCKAKQVVFRNVNFILADGLRGWSKEAPYNVIFSGVVMEKIPDELLEQLEIGGRLWAPMSARPRSAWLVTKITEKNFKTLEINW